MRSGNDRFQEEQIACLRALPIPLPHMRIKGCIAYDRNPQPPSMKGTLRLLTPVSLPERAQVRDANPGRDKIGDEVQRAAALLEATGLVKPAGQLRARLFISQARRAELAQITLQLVAIRKHWR